VLDNLFAQIVGNHLNQPTSLQVVSTPSHSGAPVGTMTVSDMANQALGWIEGNWMPLAFVVAGIVLLKGKKW
jgi:hypothetical protein